jgi:hypothetical protein
MFEFFLSIYLKSENYFYKSLKTYKKNYFSIIHSGEYDLKEYVDDIQYMLANSLYKKIPKESLVLSASFYAFCAKKRVIVILNFYKTSLYCFFK